MPKKFVNYLTNALTKKRREPNNNKLVTDAAALPNAQPQAQEQAQQQQTIIDVDHESSSSSTNIGNVTKANAIMKSINNIPAEIIHNSRDITNTTTTTDPMLIDNNNIGNSPENHQQLATVNYGAMSPQPELYLTNNNNSITNTALSLNNPQAQTILQITNSNAIHIGSTFVIQNNNQNTNNPLKKSPMINKTKKHKSGKHGGGGSDISSTINAMMRSKCELEHATMNIISEHLGDEWQFIFRHLGYSQGQIEQHIMDNNIPGSGRTKEAIYQLLLDATRNDKITLGSITRILWEYNHQDVVHKLKDYWKPLYIASKLAAKESKSSSAQHQTEAAAAAGAPPNPPIRTPPSKSIDSNNHNLDDNLENDDDASKL